MTRSARLAMLARTTQPHIVRVLRSVEHGTSRLLGRSLPKLDRHYARAEEGSRVKLADARAAGVVAPTVLTVALTWVLGRVSSKVLPRSWSALLLMGMLGLIAMTVDASRRARA